MIDLITGFGVDVVYIDRMNEKLADRILGDEEKKLIPGSRKKEFLAGRFALKEAFFKALGTGLNGHSFKDLEFLKKSSGEPLPVLHKDFRGFNMIHATLSHDVVAIGAIILEYLEGNVYLALGTNLGDRMKNLEQAVKLLEEHGVYPRRKSHVYETEPYGLKNQPPFLNLVLEVETRLSPHELLDLVLYIEKLLGRERKEKWGPRKIDIDILFYGNLIVRTENLVIPHYDLQNRDFFLRPFLDIEPEYVHPVLEKRISEMYKELKKDSCVPIGQI